MVIVCQHLQQTWMAERPPDFLLAVESVDKRGISLHSGVRNLEHDRLIRLKISAAENRRYAVMGNDTVQAVMIELIAKIHGQAYLEEVRLSPATSGRRESIRRQLNLPRNPVRVLASGFSFDEP